MEDYIKKIVKYVLDEKYPEFEDVEVTSEMNPRSLYTDKKRNIVYNVFLTIDGIKFLNKNTIKSIGIENTINVYIDFSDEK